MFLYLFRFSKKNSKQNNNADIEKPYVSHFPAKAPLVNNRLANSQAVNGSANGFVNERVSRIPRATLKSSWDSKANREMTPCGGRKSVSMPLCVWRITWEGVEGKLKKYKQNTEQERDDNNEQGKMGEDKHAWFCNSLIKKVSLYCSGFMKAKMTWPHTLLRLKARTTPCEESTPNNPNTSSHKPHAWWWKTVQLIRNHKCLSYSNPDHWVSLETSIFLPK